MENKRTTSINIGNSTVAAAQELYALGFNVIPLQFGVKASAGNWKMLQHVRLPEGCLKKQFEGRNIGVLTGRASMNLFVVDCDSKESFAYWSKELHEKGLYKWVVSSANGGHIWFLSQDGEVHRPHVNVNATKLGKKKKDKDPKDNYQIWGQRHYVVVPPSIRIGGVFSGTMYSWLHREGDLPPILSASEIKDIFSNVTVTESLLDGNITRLAHQAIVKHDEGEYVSHSEAEFAAVCSLVRIGWCDEDIFGLFEKHQPPHYAKSTDSEKWFEEYMLKKAHQLIPYSKGARLKRALEWSADRKWEGRTGRTNKLVFEACCQKAKHSPTTVFSASAREIGKLTNQEAKTTSKALRRLVDAGFLILRTPQKKSKTKEVNRFQIHDEILNYYSNEIATCTIPVVLSSTFREHDIWHIYGLGKAALFVYEYLVGVKYGKNQTSEEIFVGLQKRMDISRRTVKNTLTRLVSAGLAIESDGKWNYVSLSPEKLDEIAERMGVLGKVQKREERKMAERQSYALWILTQTQKPPSEKKSMENDSDIPSNEIAICLEEEYVCVM